MRGLVKNHGYFLIVLFFLFPFTDVRGHYKPLFPDTLNVGNHFPLFDLTRDFEQSLSTSAFSSSILFKISHNGNKKNQIQKRVAPLELLNAYTREVPSVAFSRRFFFGDTLGKLRTSSNENEVNTSSGGCGPLLLLPAPSNMLADDKKNTFDWTNTPGYDSLEYYEYTVDGGTIYQPVTAKPQTFPDLNFSPGQIGVRIKEGPGNHASETLFSAEAFTAGAVAENMISYSENFDRATSNQTWQPLNCSTRDGFWSNPFGTAKAIYLSLRAGAIGYSQLNTFCQTNAGTAYTASFYVKYDNLQYCKLEVYGTLGQQNVWATFDVKNGKVSSMGSSCMAAVSTAANGWYRVSVTFTAMSTNNAKISISHPTALAAGDDGKGYYMFGAQFNRGISPANYIKTP